MTARTPLDYGAALARKLDIIKARSLLRKCMQSLPPASAERAALEAAIRMTHQADDLRRQELAADRAPACPSTYTPPARYAGPVSPAED